MDAGPGSRGAALLGGGVRAGFLPYFGARTYIIQRSARLPFGRSRLLLCPDMADLSHHLQLRQQQRLVMTPQLKQALKILQLNTMELGDLIETELS